VPNANIERAIAKGSGQGAGGADAFEEVRYEGYGPGGVAILIESLTDNRNRTAAELRLAFSKNGGNLGESGCVGYLFEHHSVVRIEQRDLQEDVLLESLLTLEEQGGPAAVRCLAPSRPSKPCRTACAAWAGPCRAGSTAGSHRPPAASSRLSPWAPA
jgi:hypothetical protein